MKNKQISEQDINQLSLILDKLVVLLQEETKLIERKEIAKLEGTFEEKKRLIGVLEHFQQQVKKQPLLLQSLGAAAKEKLKAQYQRFNEQMETHQQSLDNAYRKHKRIMSLISEAIKEHTQREKQYSKKGSKAGKMNMLNAMTLDQQV